MILQADSPARLVDIERAVDPLLDYTLFVIGGTPVTVASIVTFFVILIVALIASALAQRWMRGVYTRRGVDEGVQYALNRLLGYIILAFGVLMALSNTGIKLGALAALGAALGVGLGFGLQNIAQNFVSGVILLLERPVKRGDYVEVGGTAGTVREIRARATLVTTLDNVDILVPNGQFISEPVINQTFETRLVRARVAVGVAYGSDTALVRDTLMRVALAHPTIMRDPEPAVRFTNFGESSLDFAVVFWLADPVERLEVESDLRYAIDAAFREAGIAIPFPQRDLHLRSGWSPATE